MADIETPDIYSDLFNIMENPLGVMVMLARTDPPVKGQPAGTQQSTPVVVLRFSPENWKILMMSGRKQLKTRETNQGAPFKIDAALLTSLNLTEADW